MAYKLDVTVIVKNHFKTLINDNTKQRDFRDVFFFILLPIAIGIAVPLRGVFVNKDFISSVIGGLAIYVGLSLNLAVLLFEIAQKGASNLKRDFAKDFIANICFSVLLSITTIVSSLFTVLEYGRVGKFISHAIFYFLLCHMVLVILMLLKRLYYQLIEQVSETNTDKQTKLLEQILEKLSEKTP